MAWTLSDNVDHPRGPKVDTPSQPFGISLRRSLCHFEPIQEVWRNVRGLRQNGGREIGDMSEEHGVATTSAGASARSQVELKIKTGDMRRPVPRKDVC